MVKKFQSNSMKNISDYINEYTWEVIELCLHETPSTDEDSKFRYMLDLLEEELKDNINICLKLSLDKQ